MIDFNRKLIKVLLPAGCLLFLIWGTSFSQEKPEISSTELKRLKSQDPSFQSQIAAATSKIRALKAGITGDRRKLSTDLLQLIDDRYLPEGQSSAAHAAEMERLKQFRSDRSIPILRERILGGLSYVYIYLHANTTTEIVDPYVWKVTDRDDRKHIVVAWVEVRRLELLASLEGVRFIRTVVPPMLNSGSVTTEGDGIHRTNDVRSSYTQSGSGIKVGIISNGVDSRATAQSSNDLPADGAGLTVLSNSVGGEEGTAMLEIVHDMVPEASLYFHDCGNNTVAFNSAIDDLITAGCDIICDDIGWVTQPFFEEGNVASHVQSVLTSNDIIYVSSAGNAGQKHYQGDYYPISGSTQHDFSHLGPSGFYLYISMPAEGSVWIVFQWNDQFGASGNDYDLYLYNENTETIVDNSMATQDGNDDPLEFISYTAPDTAQTANYYIMVDKWSGAGKTLEVFIYPSNGTSVYSNNITPDDAIFGHAAVTGAMAVGAIAANDPGNDDIESFSSLGPVTISYPSSESRAKPDICGIDGVSVTGAGGFSNTFYGTSAAAPHVAAIAAQLWAQLSSHTGDQIRDMITGSAVDLGATGFDNTYGYGRADAWNAFNNNVPDVLTKVKIWLEGPYQPGGSMSTDLNSGDHIPVASPYLEAPRSVSNIPSGVIDWVMVELRSTPSGSAVRQQSFFLKSDGSIVDTDGSTTDLFMGGVSDGEYYIIARHRNHLAIMSASPQTLDGDSPSLYDFTTEITQYYQSIGAKELESDVWGMYSGDANCDGFVTAYDKNEVWRPQNGTNGYKGGDLNLDGFITALDKNEFWRPNNGMGSSVQ